MFSIIPLKHRHHFSTFIMLYACIPAVYKNIYAFVDVEVGMKDLKVHDIGALRWDGAVFQNYYKTGRRRMYLSVSGKKRRGIVYRTICHP